MTDDVPTLDSKRWEKTQDPNKHRPIDALKAAVRDVEAGHLKPRHVVIVYCTEYDADGDSSTGFYQAGNIDGHFGAMGLLARGLQIMGDS